MNISRAEARRYLSHLHFELPMTTETPSGMVREQVARRGSIQYDPLDVAGRNADLVLQSRIPGYRPNHLWEALYGERTLFDGFDKNLSIYPIEDFPYFARARRGEPWIQANDSIRKCSKAVLKEITERGPLCSDDLPFDENVDWPWGPTKVARAALESLWMRGELVLHRRVGARRYYDLIHRHLPQSILSAPDPNERDEDYHAWQLLRRIGSVGLLFDSPSDALLGTAMKAADRLSALRRLLSEGKLTALQIEGFPKPAYMRTADLAVLESARASEPDGRMRVIAPLDNLIWDRRLIESLYGFQYRWEVYVPAPQRKFGYYVLPVYWRDEFVARFEPAHFRGGKLKILKWWWEKAPDRGMKAARRACLKEFCRYLGSDGFEILEE